MRTCEQCFGDAYLPKSLLDDQRLAGYVMIYAIKCATNIAIDEILRQGGNVTSLVDLSFTTARDDMVMVRATVGSTPVEIDEGRITP